MAIRLDTSDPAFEAQFAAFLAAKRETAEDVEADVRKIIADVRARGDAALQDLSLKLDRIDLSRAGVRVTAREIAEAVKVADAGTLKALELARDRIEAHHRRQVPKDDAYVDAIGAKLGTRW